MIGGDKSKASKGIGWTNSTSKQGYTRAAEEAVIREITKIFVEAGQQIPYTCGLSGSKWTATQSLSTDRGQEDAPKVTDPFQTNGREKKKYVNRVR